MPVAYLKQPPISLNELRAQFLYDPETGLWIWKSINKYMPPERLGSRAGYRHHSGRWVLKVGDKGINAARIAYFYMTGQWPSVDVDHKNGDVADDRWENLRLATRAQNNRNVGKKSRNRSGVKGVSWHAATGKWISRITVNYKQIHLGVFDDFEEAVRVYREASIRLHGSFSRF